MNSLEHCLYYRGRFFELVKEPHDAARDYRKALELKPDFMRALIGLSILYASIQQYPPAVECTQKIIAREPKNANWLFNLAYIHEKQRRFAEAIKAFERSIAIDPKLDRAWYAMGVAFSAQEITRGRRNPSREGNGVAAVGAVSMVPARDGAFRDG